MIKKQHPSAARLSWFKRELNFRPAALRPRLSPDLPFRDPLFRQISIKKTDYYKNSNMIQTLKQLLNHVFAGFCPFLPFFLGFYSNSFVAFVNVNIKCEKEEIGGMSKISTT